MNQTINQQTTEKRKKISLSKEEKDIIISLLIKAAIPITVIIWVSSVALFFGFHFLIQKTGFSNFALSPRTVVESVSQFISTYIILSLINILLMMVLSI